MKRSIRVAPHVYPQRKTVGGGRFRRAKRIAVYALLVALLLPVPPILLFRFVPPPVSALMVIRWVSGVPIHQHWVPLRRISPSLIRAVVASEDETFCTNDGFDWTQLDIAWHELLAGRRPRGASTITMQTAKNLFLWPDHSYLRKAIEAYITVLLNLFWSKQRIIETYLNIIEWGNGIYGAEEAARFHFHRSAAALTPWQSALLAAVLPDPRHWSPDHPNGIVEARAALISRRMPAMAVPSLRGCR